MTVEQDFDDTVRLVLMDKPKATFIDFVKDMRRVSAGFGLVELRYAFTRYKGWDGRVPPTHDVETGLPLRGAA